MDTPMKTLGLRVLLVLIFAIFAVAIQPVLAEEVIEEKWSIIHIGGSRAGTAYMKQTRFEEDGKTLIRTRVESKMTIMRGGQGLTVEVNYEMVESEEGTPIRYTNLTKQAGAPVETSAEVKDGKLITTAKIMGNEQTIEVDFAPETLGLHGLDLLMKGKGLHEGTEYETLVLTPDVGKVMTLTFKVGGIETVELLGETAELHRVESTMSIMPGITATSWLDSSYDTKLEYIPIAGMEIRTYWVSKEKAMAEPVEGEGSARAPDVMVDNFIRPSHAMAHPRGIRSATFRLRAKKGSVPELLEDEVQKVIDRGADGSVTLRIEAADPEGDTVPFPVEDEDYAEFLKNSVYLQCDDPEIVAEAKKIVGDEKDAYRAAKKLERWVYERIDEKGYDVGFASAKEVFNDRKGDCSEHGVLLAAMTRAVGIPSRVATGVEYIMGIFGWHMWTEVWVGQWVPLDATVPSPFVDATHIKFSESSMNDPTFDESMFKMVSIIGNLEIDVVEYALGEASIKPDSPEAKGRLTYSHPLLGISFQVPEGWTYSEGPAKRLCEIVPAEGDSKISVAAMALSYDSSVEEIVKVMELKRKIESRTELEVGGHAGVYLKGERELQVLVQPTDTLYMFRMRRPTEETTKVFEKFIATVKISR
ncbi:MAG: transglutaminase-like domain-containing protein [Planctomycetota bacterium]|nr:transglutaminase-like domain-containing protein [Planctomycetota bacterium]